MALLELGRFDEAEAAFLAAEGLAAKRGDRRLAMRIAVNRGLSADLRGDFESAGLRYGEAEALARSLGDAPSLGLVLKNAAARLWRLARYEESVAAYREALAVIEPTGIAYAQAAARIGLGYALARLGRPAEARAELDAAFALSREAGIDDSPSPESCLAYAELAEASGDAAEARKLVAEALRVAVRGGERRLLPPALEAAARRLQGEGSARAARLARDIRERLRLPVPPCDAPDARLAGAPATGRPVPGTGGGWLEAYAEAMSIAEGLFPHSQGRRPGNAVADGPEGH